MSKEKPSKTHCDRGHATVRGNVVWNGRSWSCKLCNRITGKINRTHRRKSDPFGFALTELRRNAKKRNQPFDLTKVDFIPLPSHCPVLGVELDYSGAGGPNAASIDRTDCKQGYVRGNVVIMSRRANTLKNDASAEELRMVLNYIENIPKLPRRGQDTE